MNGDKAGILSLVDGILSGLAHEPLARCEVLLLPSFIHLDQVAQRIAQHTIGLGAQDLDSRDAGAVTGGTSVSMIRDIGCTYALVGHSERRQLFLESDQIVAEKFEQCSVGGITPIVCVGETLQERERGETLEVVRRQLTAVTDRVGAAGFAKALVAYEPVWAIGSGQSATPEQAEAVHAGLRAVLGALSDELAAQTRVLYGGSVTAENAASLFAQENVDGALVGGASLNATSFVKICKAANES